MNHTSQRGPCFQSLQRKYKHQRRLLCFWLMITPSAPTSQGSSEETRRCVTRGNKSASAPLMPFFFLHKDKYLSKNSLSRTRWNTGSKRGRRPSPRGAEEHGNMNAETQVPSRRKSGCTGWTVDVNAVLYIYIYCYCFIYIYSFVNGLAGYQTVLSNPTVQFQLHAALGIRDAVCVFYPAGVLDTTKSCFVLIWHTSQPRHNKEQSLLAWHRSD